MREPDEIWIHTKIDSKDAIRIYALSRAYQNLSRESQELYMEKKFPLYDEYGIKIPATYNPNHKEVGDDMRYDFSIADEMTKIPKN